MTPPPSPASTDPIQLSIHGLGGLGDGLAHHCGETVFVPHTCPGDTVMAQLIPGSKRPLRARLTSILHPSAHRQQPPCPHFGVCGGCTLQHLDASTYYQFKRSILERTIAQLGLESDVIQPMIEVGSHSRRRVEFKIALRKGRIDLGFFAANSHDIVAISACPVSDPVIASLIPAIRDALEALKKPGSLLALRLTALDDGVDALLVLRAPLDATDRDDLIAFAKRQRLLRLSVCLQNSEDSTCLFNSQNASIVFAGVRVELPAGAFLQASAAGQTGIASVVTGALAHCKWVADLYSGCGTYGFHLIQHSNSVAAFEGSADMAAAMHNAIVHHQLEKRITVTARNLSEHPLSAEELGCYDGIVINPPRTGAPAQTNAISRSNVQNVVMVSCNPATFQRDALTLLKGGYRLRSATPIDQFYWSGHLEIAAVFTKTAS